MRTRLPTMTHDTASRTLACLRIGPDADYGAWSSRHGNPRAYPPLCVVTLCKASTFAPYGNGHSVGHCRHRLARVYLAVWMLTRSWCAKATGQLRPDAWSATTEATGFEPVLMIAEPGGLERRIRAVWKGAVRVAGADLDAVAGRFEKDRAVEGWATVTGTWSGEQLRVERQDAPVAGPALARWVTPPCPLLECGWPAVERRGDVELSYDLGDLAGTGAAVAITFFHPARTRRYWSSLPLTLPLWRLARVLPEIAVWAASLPRAFVTLEPWLIPAGGDCAATC